MAVVLIVDDEVFIRDFAEIMMGDFGHTTLVAANMDQALVHLSSPEPIDLLFTDIRLKSVILGGFELAQQAVKLRPKLRVLYTTGSPLTDKMTALFVEGARFIQKPYTQDQLHNSVETLLVTPL